MRKMKSTNQENNIRLIDYDKENITKVEKKRKENSNDTPNIFIIGYFDTTCFANL